MPAETATPSRFKHMLDSDLGWSFRTTPAAWLSALVLALLVLSALFSPLIAPQNPYDLSQIFIDKAEIPPIWSADGEWPFLLGTDPQGRDVLSAILYGTRISLIIGFAAVVVSMAFSASAPGFASLGCHRHHPHGDQASAGPSHLPPRQAYSHRHLHH